MEIDKLAKLARERVHNVKNLNQLLNVFELTHEQFEEIEKDPTYQRILEHYNIEWNSALTTPQRVQLRSAVWLEDNMDILGTRMANPSEPIGGVVEVAKILTKIAGIGEKKDEAVGAERFVITINLGADEKLVIDKPIAKDLALSAITDQSESK